MPRSSGRFLPFTISLSMAMIFMLEFHDLIVAYYICLMSWKVPLYASSYTLHASLSNARTTPRARPSSRVECRFIESLYSVMMSLWEWCMSLILSIWRRIMRVAISLSTSLSERKSVPLSHFYKKLFMICISFEPWEKDALMLYRVTIFIWWLGNIIYAMSPAGAGKVSLILWLMIDCGFTSHATISTDANCAAATDAIISMRALASYAS